jgi:GH15 family glucan-1,4-alpha-glucosidase
VRIEDLALIGDTQTAALVARDGTVCWLCLPRFDSAACFASLLGDRSNGHWRLSPAGEVRRVRRRYRGDSLVLETEFETDGGTVRLIDAMPPRDVSPDVVRLVEGVSGRVDMRMELTLRFDYGEAVPWVRRVGRSLRAIAGPDAVEVVTPVELRGEDLHTVSDFAVSAGEKVPFVLRWHPSHELPRPPLDVEAAIRDTESWWEDWSSRGTFPADGPWRDPVQRSLITLKALTYAPTGGIVAAPTTSLPERLGGVRNWDYRYCWLRDATFTLYALLQAGYTAEAAAWRDWLLRAIAGEPSKLQIMYGPAGERRLDEYELDHLSGYEGSSPVRVGNAASRQFQLDVFGEVFDVMLLAERAGIPAGADSWGIGTALLEYLESAWKEPDEGIWEVRGPRRHFTHSKVMAWVAADRAVHLAARGAEGGPDRWKKLRAEIHADVCANGYDASRGTFTQSYGSKDLDAALLRIPAVGFLPADDPRVLGTVACLEADLLTPDGFMRRYDNDSTTGVDGLPPGEACFLPCSFWLADAYALAGRMREARAMFERLRAVANDVGLLAEEYDPVARRLLGNFPQAFSHVALVNTARNLVDVASGPAQHRLSGAQRT